MQRMYDFLEHAAGKGAGLSFEPRKNIARANFGRLITDPLGVRAVKIEIVHGSPSVLAALRQRLERLAPRFRPANPGYAIHGDSELVYRVIFPRLRPAVDVLLLYQKTRDSPQIEKIRRLINGS
ncbi:MAG: hypothetical protein V1708_06065 [Candidatus Micrarchaeota archaeon]